MLLPHMPSSIVPHLPTLFNIYARILFWSRERVTLIDGTAQPNEHASDWDVCPYDPRTEDANISHLDNYYTILYGLYPINFMDYIRKPQRYLRHANIDNADDVEVQPTEIRHQSERFRRCHVLHPNFYTLTIESEKTDFGRWIKSEAAEVAAECMSLHVASNESYGLDHRSEIMNEPPRMPEFDIDGGDSALLSSSLVMESRHDHSTSADSGSSYRAAPIIRRPDSPSSRPSDRDSGDARTRASVTDSPALSAHLAASTSHTHLQDMLQSNKAIKSGLTQSLANDSVPSLSLSHHDEKSTSIPIPSSKAPGTPSVHVDLDARVAQLQRQTLLLQNDLTFERYQKQQHMAHIGDLRRRLVSESASEAETQNLILTNRGLKSRYEEAKKAEMQVRKESEKGRTMAKNREGDLYNKLKKMKEDVKRMEAELATGRSDLSELQKENEKLRKMILDAEVREARWEEHRQANEMHVTELDRQKMELSRLSLVEREAQGQEQARKEALTAAELSDSRASTLKLELDAQKNDLQRSKREFHAQIESMQEALTEARQRGASKNGNSEKASADLEKLLATGHQKQAELKKQYDLLSRKYTALQSSLLDMQSSHVPISGRTEGGGTASPDSADANMSISPTTMPKRPQRILSETNMSATSADDARRPSEAGSLNALSSGTTGEASSEQTPTSPEQRYFGRGKRAMFSLR